MLSKIYKHTVNNNQLPYCAKRKPDMLIGGRYQLKRQLGIGAFGDTWLAYDEISGIDVAIKIIDSIHNMDDFFKSEYQNSYVLDHPNILHALNYGKGDNISFLVMKFCVGGSVSRLVGKMNEAQIWRFISDVAGGLTYLHSKGYIHSDIKPDNILIDDSGEFRITDFGCLAKANNNNRLCGTEIYMAPERYERNALPFWANDIWSLGATLFELLTGDLPFEQGGILQRYGMDIPNIDIDCSDKLKITIIECLSKDPNGRPTAEQLLRTTHGI